MNIDRLLEKENSYASSIVYEFFMCAESTLNERNGSTNEHKNEMTYSSDEHVPYMLENSSDEDEITSQWDTNMLQNILFDNEDTEENYNDQNIFLTNANNNIMHLRNEKQSTLERQGACMNTKAE